MPSIREEEVDRFVDGEKAGLFSVSGLDMREFARQTCDATVRPAESAGLHHPTRRVFGACVNP